jgi:hypothetical protein
MGSTLAISHLFLRRVAEIATMDIPQDLMASAYLSQDGEAAWCKEDVLQVIRWATASKLAVFGVEVWLPTKPGPTIPMPFFYSFDCKPSKGETWLEFVNRANKGAIDYVKGFQWDPEDTKHLEKQPFFNLTLGDTW